MRHIEELHIHHTATNYRSHDNIYVIRRWHIQKGWNDIGYNYFINSMGGIFIGRGVETVPASIMGRNNYAIAIALSGDFSVEGVRPSLEQVESAARLLKNLCKTFNISKSKVYGHKEIADTLCPGFDVQILRDMI